MQSHPSRALFHDMAFGTVSKVVQAPARLLLAALLARFLGTDGFGLFVTLQWTIDFAFMICSIGAASAAPRFFPGLSASNPNSFVWFDRWYSRCSIVISIVTGLAAVAMTVVLTERPSLTLLVWVFAWAILNAASALLVARIQGLLQLRVFALWNICSTGIIVGAVFALSTSMDVITAIQCHCLGNFTCVVLYLLTKYRHVPSAPTESPTSVFLTREAVIHYAINNWLGTILSALVWSRADLALLNYMISAKDIGQYAVGLTLVGFVAQSFGILMTGVSPRLTLWWNVNDRSRAYDICVEISLIMLLASALFALVACFYGGPMLSLTFGADYANGRLILGILSIGVVGLTCSCASQLLQYQTNGRFGRDVNIAGAALFLPGVVVFVSAFGPVGAALSRAAVQLTICAATFGKLAQLDGMRSASVMLMVRSGLVLAILILSLTGIEYFHLAETPVFSLPRVVSFLIAVLTVFLVVCFGRIGLSWASVRRILEY
jgi:O-antigen/teichoic acid export membrane protein